MEGEILEIVKHIDCGVKILIILGFVNFFWMVFGGKK